MNPPRRSREDPDDQLAQTPDGPVIEVAYLLDRVYGQAPPEPQ